MKRWMMVPIFFIGAVLAASEVRTERKTPNEAKGPFPIKGEGIIL